MSARSKRVKYTSNGPPKTNINRIIDVQRKRCYYDITGKIHFHRNPRLLNYTEIVEFPP